MQDIYRAAAVQCSAQSGDDSCGCTAAVDR